jgi:hypothetical protein
MQRCGVSITLQQFKMEVVELTQTNPTLFKNGIPKNSWWYWFKCQHPKLILRLAKGLEVSKAHGLTSQSFYHNLENIIQLTQI